MPIKRADGVTKSERYLKLLCDHTFLSLWSYPGVYRDQFSGKGTEGKEVCDLLVVFENHIIIFSDKDCQFPNSDKLELDWNRWFKKAIQKSADQVWGAERWITQHPNRLFLDRACTLPFPIDIPDLSIMRFHLIVVAHDNAKRCQQQLGGSGSLIINSSVKGTAHYAGENGGVPFFVGDIDPSQAFVHILDDTSLDIILGTLDTISDFVSYLTKKEKILRSDTVVFASGEENLLAYYLMNMNEEDEHDFVMPTDVDGQINHLIFDEGLWEEFSQSSERQAQVLADRVSYIWDNLIEAFSKHVIEDTQYFTTCPGIQETEPLLRFLARESRFRRRNLAAALYGLLESAPNDRRATRLICSASPHEPYYIFLTYPQFEWIATYEKYREGRRYLLEACCSSVKLKFPDAQHIIGIATEPGLNSRRSEDAIYFDATNWSEEKDARAREDSEELNIPSNPNIFNVHDQEYPLQSPQRNWIF